MAYTNITQHNSPNYTPNAQVRAIFGMNRTVQGITIHWWGDPRNNPSFEGVISWLSQTRSGTSAHTVTTGTGKRNAWLVNAVDAAWHSGSARGNATTLGLELDPRARNEDYDIAAELIADIWITYKSKLPLHRHSSWISTQCPGTYDLNRLRREAEVWYSKKTNPQPTPAPVKERSRETYNPVRQFEFNKDSRLWEILPHRVVKDSRVYKKGEKIEIRQKLTLTNGNVYFRTKYSADNEIGNGFRAGDLTEVKKPAPTPTPTPTQPPETTPPEPEWITNLEDTEHRKLVVIPAQGAQVIDLNTLDPVNDTLIPRGTKVDIAMKTVVRGKKYYISQYATNHNVANGILASDLGEVKHPSPNDKPEWRKNLQDVEDKDMWTRSETPVLNLEDGTVTRHLPINTQVYITHATQIIDVDLLVLDGMKEAIEVVYLSDKPIRDPENDLEERVSNLEKLLGSIRDLIVSFLNNLNKNKN